MADNNRACTREKNPPSPNVELGFKTSVNGLSFANVLCYCFCLIEITFQEKCVEKCVTSSQPQMISGYKLTEISPVFTG